MKIYTTAFLFAFLSLSATANEDGATSKLRVPGAVDGIITKDKDGVVDAALVIPTLSAASVIKFDLAGLLGPDERAKAGPISADVPGNTFIPKQKEKYGWLTVTLEKNEFGFYTNRGERHELSALWFSAPWDMLIEASKGNAKITDLIKAAEFKKSGFAGSKDWSRENKINLSLDKDLKPQAQLKWTRTAPPSGSSDVVVSFQNTPANKWALVGFNGNPGSSMGITSIDGLSSKLKVMGLRTRFDASDDIKSAEGWIVEAQRRSKIQFTGLPQPLKNTSLSSKQVHWSAPEGFGWMAIVHEPKSEKLMSKEFASLFDGIFPLSKIFPKISPESTINWVDPQQESSPLPSGFKSGDKVLLIFVGTSKEVPIPRPDDEDPELFTHAQSLRTIVLK